MGQVCSGQKGEQSKDTALSGDVTAEDLALLKQQENNEHPHPHHHDDPNNNNSRGMMQNHNSASSLTAFQQQQHSGTTATSKTTASSTATTSAEERERLRALQQEQQRLDMIVAAAGRGMISVRSTRGSTGYYDQGFAAALAQHLEQTTTFPSRLPVVLPLAPEATHNQPSAASAAASASGDGNVPAGSSSTSKPTSDHNNNSVYARLAKPQWEGLALGNGGGVAGCDGADPNQYMDNIAESLLDTIVPTKQHMFAGVKPMVENLL